MDNISHSLTGLALAQTGLRRWSPAGTAILLISANAPDCDIVALTGGSLAYLEQHRGYTHTLLFLPLMGLLSALLAAALFRQRLPWLRAWGLGCIGVASHLLLDWTNTYGIRLMLPFSSRWFHLDWNNLYDGFFLAVLLLSALWPLLANLVSGEIGERRSNGRAIAIAALVAIGLFECGRAFLHGRTVATLQSRIYDEQQPLQAAALPDAFNPFRWQGVVETENAYITLPVSATGQPEFSAAETFHKPPKEPVLSALQKGQESFRFGAYFARFPVWSLVPVSIDNGRGVRVDMSDLRFGTPGAGSFHFFALLNARDIVVESGFSWQPKAWDGS